MSALKINKLDHKIKNNDILKNISIETEEDKITCILGPSGSGKTTLLKLIAGLENIQKGEIYIKDKLVSSPNKNIKTEERDIGFLFQDFALFPHLTVHENLKFAIKNNINANIEIKEIMEIIKLPNSLKKYPHELSGGEQQRVALARSIISKPQLLLLDEPFSNLDLSLREEIRDDTLHLLQKFNISVIIVTHDPFEAMFISNKIYILEQNGSIVQSGSPNDLYNNPISSYVAEFFGETNKFSGLVKNSKVQTAVGEIPINSNFEFANYVFKPTQESGSKGIRYFKSKPDLMFHCQNFRGNFVVQEYVSGVGGGLSVFSNKGKIIEAYGHSRISAGNQSLPLKVRLPPTGQR